MSGTDSKISLASSGIQAIETREKRAISSAANELTGVGSNAIDYDSDGNTTLDENGNVLIYDAWNRLVGDTNLTTDHETFYSYDANGRRVTEEDSAVTGLGPVLVLNNGSAQRSMIDSLTIVFDHPVTITGTITLVGASYGTISTTVSNPSGDHQTFLITYSGTGVNATTGSLEDDTYTLTIPHTGVVNYGTTTATLSSDVTYVFDRLAGDVTGNGVVNAYDYGEFMQASGSSVGDPNYNPALDFNDDGVIDMTDYTAFSAAFGNYAGSYSPGSGVILSGPSTTADDRLGADTSSWTPDPVRDLYYDGSAQVIEERQSGVVTAQNVWSIDYVNDLLLRDDNTVSGNLGISGSGLGNRVYYQHDANYNVTATVDNSGNVIDRYVYTPYGVQTVLSSTWGGTSDPNSIYGFQGGRYDPSTGLLHFGARDYNPATGTWREADPAGYVDGASRYQSLGSNPINTVDPSGLNPPATSPSPPTTGNPIYADSLTIGGVNGTVSVYTDSSFNGAKGLIQLQYSSKSGACKDLHWIQFYKQVAYDTKRALLPNASRPKYVIKHPDGGSIPAVGNSKIQIDTTVDTIPGNTYLDTQPRVNGKDNLKPWYDGVGSTYRGVNDDELSILDKPSDVIGVDKTVSEVDSYFDDFLVCGTHRPYKVYWHVSWQTQELQGGHVKILPGSIQSDPASDLSAIGATGKAKEWSAGGNVTFTNPFI